jgi:hypothetical protein
MTLGIKKFPIATLSATIKNVILSITTPSIMALGT